MTEESRDLAEGEAAVTALVLHKQTTNYKSSICTYMKTGGRLKSANSSDAAFELRRYRYHTFEICRSSAGIYKRKVW